MHSTDELPKIKTVAHNDENFQVQKKTKKQNPNEPRHVTILQNSNFSQIMNNANEYALNWM